MPRQAPTLAMCSVECGAKCCRAPLVISVTGDELATMRAANPNAAVERGLTSEHVNMSEGTVETRTIFTFSEEPGSACPFLDQATNECTVYEVRPETCRGFPDRPELWCLAWPVA